MGIGGDIKSFYRQQKKSGGGISKSKSKNNNNKKKKSTTSPAANPAAASAESPDLHHQEEEMVMRKRKLMEFDMDMRYGPCVGLTRMERWDRASAMGLNPPPLLLPASSHVDVDVDARCLWEGRV